MQMELPIDNVIQVLVITQFFQFIENDATYTILGMKGYHV